MQSDPVVCHLVLNGCGMVQSNRLQGLICQPLEEWLCGVGETTNAHDDTDSHCCKTKLLVSEHLSLWPLLLLCAQLAVDAGEQIRLCGNSLGIFCQGST
jgi:hypothetical protein